MSGHKKSVVTKSDKRVRGVFDPLECLRMLRKKVRLADFAENLVPHVERLCARLNEIKKAGPRTYYEALSTSAQILDYYGEYVQARKLIAEEGSLVYAEFLGDPRPANEDERLLLKEKVWLTLHFARTFYRSNDNTQCSTIVGKCVEVLENHVVTTADPCFRTWGYLEYLRGQLYRQSSQYDSSIAAMDASIGRAHDKIAWFRLHPQTEAGEELHDRIAEEQAWAYRRTALASALGVGWIYGTRGLLHESATLLRAARVLLFPTGDWVNQAYVELLYGKVQRALAGHDRAKLMAAIKILERPYEAFDPKSRNGRGAGHLPYRGRAAYELALAHLYAGDLDQAEAYQREVWRIAGKKSDLRWLCHALIVHCRILMQRKAYTSALASAREAKRYAAESAQPLCRVDALIAEGEAHAALDETERAKERFLEALNTSANNVQTEAVCHLHLANLWLACDNLRKAEENFSAWLKLRDRIQNQIVHDLAAGVGRAIEAHERDFVVSWKEKNLDFDHHAERLWDFLLQRASLDYKTKEDVARALGKSRQTLYKKEQAAKDEQP